MGVTDACMSDEDVDTQIERYEHLFGMDSKKFLQMMQDGEVTDSFETMDWLILLKTRGNDNGDNDRYNP